MDIANLEDIKKIEFDLTKKLFKYIYANVNLNKLVEELDKEYSYFFDADNNLAFNIWLSLDYIGKDGKTFTEKFLEDKAETLNFKEKKILEKRKESYVSLFEIISYEGDYVYVEDLLTKEHFYLLEPDLSSIINTGEYVFSRIGLNLDHYNFIGDINYLPAENKYDFIKNLLLDFNLIRKSHKGLTMKNYLKQFGLNLYKIYDEIISNMEAMDGFDFFDMDDLKHLNEFEDYLSLKMNEDKVDIHITNISEILDSYFPVEAYNLEDLVKIDLEDLLYSSIDQGLISLKWELISYIHSLKLYFYFLKIIDSSFENLYKWIVDINKNPFKYVSHLNSYIPDFKIDKNFAYHIKDSLNKRALDLIRDFDIFILYMETNNIELTKTTKKIKRKNLFTINNSLENRTEPLQKAPNQKHFINIDLFFHIALNLKLLKIDGKIIYPTDRAIDYLQLENNEKYLILFQGVLDNLFETNDVYIKDYVFEALCQIDDYLENPNRLFLDYKHYFQLLGLTKLDFSDKDFVRFTVLAREVSKYLKANRNRDKNSIIDISSYKK